MRGNARKYEATAKEMHVNEKLKKENRQCVHAKVFAHNSGQGIDRIIQIK